MDLAYLFEAARSLDLHDAHCDGDESTICFGKTFASMRIADARRSIVQVELQFRLAVCSSLLSKEITPFPNMSCLNNFAHF